jgi:hypothetical protein
MSGDSVTSTVRVFMAFARAGRLVLDAPTDLPDGTMLTLVPVDDLLAMPVDDPSTKDSEVAEVAAVAKRRTKRGSARRGD